MKIHGKVAGPNIVTLVLPRDDGDIVFRMQAVLDNSHFDAVCPRPKPPMMLVRGKGKVEDTENAGFQTALEQWGRKRIAWLVLQSVKATDGIEWETVKEDVPDTWLGYEKELQDSGFSNAEVMRIVNAAMEANGLNEARIQEARERFLLTQAEGTQQQLPPSPNIALNSTQFSEAANAAVSDRQG